MQIQFDGEWCISLYRELWWGVALSGEVIGPCSDWREVHRILAARALDSSDE